MYPDYDIIYYTLFRTDNPYSSVSLSFSKEFAKNNRVFYVNHPYSLKDFFSNVKSDEVLKVRKKDLLRFKVRFEEGDPIPENFVSVVPPLTLPINRLSQGAMYDFFWEQNNKAVLHAIRKTIKKYNIKKYIFFNCFDPFFTGYLPKNLDFLAPELSIYQCIDDLAQDEYTIKHGLRLENEAIRKSDAAVVTSSKLLADKLHLNSNTHLLPNAVDIEIFRKVVTETFERPEDLRPAKGRIIGFTGNLDYLRVNYPLIKKVAEHFKNDTIALVGPINNTEYLEIGLDKMPNVLFCGAKKIQDLPPYLQHFDACIIPYLFNQVTASIYPLKINEYLAAGKPVVSTSFSDDIKSFGNVIYLADNDDEFLQQVERAMSEHNQEKRDARIAVAQQNTWTSRVERFWEIVEETKAMRNR